MAQNERLISADALSESISNMAMYINGIRFGQGVLSEYIKEYRKSILKIVDEQPTVDAVKVVHGRWIHVDDAEYRCNQCKNHVCFDELLDRSVPEYNYCPHCGAKMDGDEDEVG